MSPNCLDGLRTGSEWKRSAPPERLERDAICLRPARGSGLGRREEAPVNWQELETFLTLAEELHFGRTAERLHISSPRVSQMIKALERRIGAPLFERTSRQVVLTSFGRQLREELDPHHRGVLAALARVTDSARGLGGVLRLGFSSPLASELLMTIVEAFRAAYPDCDIHIREVHLSNRVTPLRNGDIDIQFIELPVDDPEIACGPVLLRDPCVLAVSSDHRLAGRETVSLEDLADEQLLMIEGMPGYFVDRHFPVSTPSGRPIRHVPITTYWQELLTLVAAGRGVTIAAAQGTRYYPRPNLVYIPFDDVAPFEYGLFWRADTASAKVLAFARTAQQVSSRLAGSGQS
ncbi:LysR family transcriptional regulator [Nocardia cyriacigeorgica]|uniref:LysR family transcriptional regulator n=1 Tax=Nocardia cyriacigeorgica TaxID=135487 RepID=UPI00313EDEED